MTNEEQEIWQKLKRFQVGDPHSSFSFADRLARENDWSAEYANRVIHEYKKFIFLIVKTKQPMTPSDEVDQAWHLHLLYTESYWDDMCRDLLGLKINHGPTKGGGSEKAKYWELYERTKTCYREVFEHEPPADIWPSNEVRFSNIIFTRVNRHQNWVIRKPKFLN